MRQKNNGQGEANILQNQFTAYLMTALRWQKCAYLRKRINQGSHESFTDLNDTLAGVQTDSHSTIEQRTLESLALTQTLGQISERDRYIFLERVLEERSFDVSAK